MWMRGSAAMSETPEISVVMSVYNNEQTLALAMDSVLNQEGIDLEFIVVDDGSTDRSGSIIDDYARRNPRVKPLHQENQGLTAALRAGCALATAPWIARQDADDVSLPGRLRMQLQAGASDPHNVLIGCQSRCRSPEGDLLSEVRDPTDPVEARRHVLELQRAISPHGTIMFRRSDYEAIGGYRAPFYYAQDVDLNIRLAERGGVFALPEFLYEFKYSPASISGSSSHIQMAFYRLILESQLVRARGESDEAILAKASELSDSCRKGRSKRGSEFMANYFMASCLLNRNPARAAEHFAKAIAARPYSIKALVGWGRSRWKMMRSVE